MHRTRTLVALLAMSALAFAPTAASDWTVVDVVLQSTENPYKVQHIEDLLSSDAYVASLAPGLVAAHDENDSIELLRRGRDPAVTQAERTPLDPRFIYLGMQPITSNLFSLTTVSTDGDRARAALDIVVKNLQDLRRDDVRALEEQLDDLTGEVRGAMARVDVLQEQRAELDRECGGLNPVVWLEEVQDQLANARKKRWDLDRRLAVERGIREHLAGRLERLERNVTLDGEMVPNPRLVELQAELSRARTELNILEDQTQHHSTTETDAKLAELTRGVSELEIAVSSAPQLVPGPARSARNPDHRDVEKKLIKAEEHLAEFSVELAALDKVVAELQHEVLQTKQLAARFESLEREMGMAQGRLHDLQSSLENVQTRNRERNHPAVHVISGPSEVQVTLQDGASRVR